MSQFEWVTCPECGELVTVATDALHGVGLVSVLLCYSCGHLVFASPHKEGGVIVWKVTYEELHQHLPHELASLREEQEQYHIRKGRGY